MINSIEVRRFLNKNPEPSCQEYKATKFLYDNLIQCSALRIERPLKTGLVAFYQPNHSNHYTLFRADMDALPVNESSVNFVHSCGHDVHTAILYEFLVRCLKNGEKHNIIFVFQPAEEAAFGAKGLLQSKVFDNVVVDQCFALHVTDEYPIGSVYSNNHTLFSSSLEIDLIFHGKESHITRPDLGIDTLKATNLFISKLVQNKGVFIGIGRVHCGSARNITPGNSTLEITIRALNNDLLHVGVDSIVKTLDYVNKTCKTKHVMKFGSHCPCVRNNKNTWKDVFKKLQNSYPIQICPTFWTAEDFGYFTEQFPGFMFWLGTRNKNESKVGLHNVSFSPSDDLIQIGADILSHIVADH